MYYNPSSDGLAMSHVNPDVNAVPTFENFNFDLSNKSEFYAAESITSIYIYFDSNIGSSTNISSQNGTISGISPFESSYFYFNYFCGSITDNLTITSYNSNNTKYKTVVIPITLKTTPVVPLGFTNTPTTQNYTYNNIVVNFNKAVKSISSITSLNQPSQTITYTTNNTSSIVLTNYKTPSNISDTLTFNGVVDTSDISNTSSVSKTVDNLKVGPSFVSVSSSNTISQNWTYTDIEAVFTKDIIQNPTTPITITASSGNQPTNIRIVDGKIKFDWTTSNVSSSTLTFNNLYASDFTFDDGTVETTTFTLSSQPITPQWYANQPVSKNTTYVGVEVNFNKRISSVDIVSDGTISNKIINERGNVQFDIITGTTNSTYTFNNIVAEDKGRNTGLVLTTGPTITSYSNSTGITNDNKVLIQTTNQTFSITFNKSISNEPTITLNSGTGVYVSKLNNTLTYNLSNITVGSNQITFGTVLASDASSSSGLTVPLVPVPALTFDYIADVSQPLITKDTFDVGTLYDLYFKLKDQSLNADFSGVEISINGGGADIGAISQVHNSSSYKFTLTPTASGNDKQLTVTNAKDINSFIYPSISSLANLKFIIYTLPPVSTTSGTIALSYSSKFNYAYGDSLVTDASQWTWDFYIKLPTMVNPWYLPTGGFFGGISWQVRDTTVWIRGGSDWVAPPLNLNWSFSSPRRLTLTRSGNTISLFVDGSYVYSITDSSRVTNLQVTGLNDRDIYPADGRIWGMSIWNTVRTPAQILSNQLDEVAHHWLLNGNLQNSVSGGVTLSEVGTVTYATV
jgi:hypothetical protein